MNQKLKKKKRNNPKVTPILLCRGKKKSVCVKLKKKYIKL